MEHIEKIEIEELLKQRREEIMRTPHAMKIEVIVPPVTFDTLMGNCSSITPCVVTDANGGCNAFTIALGLYTLNQYIESNLKSRNMQETYEFIKSIIDRTDEVEANIKKKEGTGFEQL